MDERISGVINDTSTMLGPLEKNKNKTKKNRSEDPLKYICYLQRGDCEESKGYKQEIILA